MTKEEKSRRNFVIWLRAILAILLVISYGLLLFTSIKLNIFPTTTLLIGFSVYGLVTTFLFWVLVDSKRFKNAVWCIIAAILGLAGLVVNLYLSTTFKETDSLFSSLKVNDSYVEYSIIAKKDRGIKIETASEVSVIKTDTLVSEQKEALGEKTNATISDQDDLTNLVASLDGAEAPIASLRTASLRLLQDSEQEIFKNIVVLGTFRVKDSTNQEQPVRLKPTDPFLLYISGIDTYGDIDTVSRGDVNIIMAINPTKRTILLVNTPRDYYVQLHGTDGLKDKLTHAGIYGINTSRQTLEDLYGVDIPYYMRVNFTSLVNIIDTIGPIEVMSDYDFKSFKSGLNTLDSKQALAFARERYSFEAGDRQRGRNQQHVIEAIIAKMNRPENAVKLPTIINQVKDSIETNIPEQFLREMTKYQLENMGHWTVSSIAVDGTGSMQPTYSYSGRPLYVMIPEEESVQSAKRSIAEELQIK